MLKIGFLGQHFQSYCLEDTQTKLAYVTENITFLHGSVVVSKHGLYVGSPGSIPTAVTTMTAAGGDAEHVSLNH